MTAITNILISALSNSASALKTATYLVEAYRSTSDVQSGPRALQDDVTKVQVQPDMSKEVPEAPNIRFLKGVDGLNSTEERPIRIIARKLAAGILIIHRK